MMRFIFMMIVCFYSLSANADDYTAIALEAEQHKAEMIQKYLNVALEAKNNEVNSINNYKDNFKKYTNGKDENKVIIFVSFSMPEQSIVSLMKDAKKIHASIVIRGLIHNSFKETFLKMASIVKEAGGGGVELNPPAFKKYNIQNVPAVVVLPTSQTCFSEKICAEEKFDVIYGDIPLYDALKAIRDHGAISKHVAEPLMLNMGELSHA